MDLERAIVSNMTFQSDLAFDGAGNLFLTGLAPPNGREAAILTTLPIGNFTAIVSGKNGETGGALVDGFIRFDDVTALPASSFPPTTRNRLRFLR